MAPPLGGGDRWFEPSRVDRAPGSPPPWERHNDRWNTRNVGRADTL